MTAIIASYYTPAYEPVARDHLLRSLAALGLPAAVLAHPHEFDSWRVGCAYKAEYLRELYETYPDRSLLWIDADAVIHADPLPFMRTLEADVGAHYRFGRILLSGTVWLRGGSEVVRRLLRRWNELNREHPNRFDQRNLARAIRETAGLRVADLPPEYCFIFDRMRKDYPECTPVIEHFQASRRIRPAKRRSRR